MAATSNTITAQYHCYEGKPFDTYSTEGKNFAIFKQSITTKDSLDIDVSGYIAVVLYPLQANTLTIKAQAVITLAAISATKGSLTLQVAGKVVSLTGQVFDRSSIEAEGVISTTLEASYRSALVHDFHKGMKLKDTAKIGEALCSVAEVVNSLHLDTASEEPAATFFNIPKDDGSAFTVRTSYTSDTIFDVCSLNGAKFAIFKKPVKNDAEIYLDLQDYTVIFLEGLEAKQKVTIKAHALIALAKIRGPLALDVSNVTLSLRGQSWSETNCNREAINLTRPALEEERLSIIQEVFQEGCREKGAALIFDGLSHIYETLENSAGDAITISAEQVLQFFSIPTKETEESARPQ